MHRAVHDLIGGAHFDNAPGVHHRNPVRQTSHNSQIMRDPDHGRVVFCDQLLNLEQNLRLNSDIKSRRGLVRNDQVRLVQQRNCDGNALAHPA